MKRRVTKLSQLAAKINAYILLNGDADIISIGSHSNSPEKIQYSFDLKPLNDETWNNVQSKAIKITYDEIQLD